MVSPYVELSSGFPCLETRHVAQGAVSEGRFDDGVEGRLCLPATLFSLNCRDTLKLRPAAASQEMELVLPERQGKEETTR